MRIVGQLVDLTDTIRVDLVGGVQQVIGVERRGVQQGQRGTLDGPAYGASVVVDPGAQVLQRASIS